MAEANQPDRTAGLDLIIVGAGFAGIYALYKFRREGMECRVLESGRGVGGVWFWNRYPGARCDVESVDYSYSFDDALQQDWVWTEKYAAQPEIRAYIEHVVERFDLAGDIQLGTTVTSAAFDEATARWTVATADGERLTARYLIMATGPLSAAIKPDIPGLDDFSGPTYYTSNWPDEKIEFTGKRVGIFGTGSSGLQTVPVVAAEARHLYVFQRTPNYSVPAQNRPLDAGELAAIKAEYPKLREAQRRSPVGNRWSSDANPRSVFDYSEADRDAVYEASWQQGGAAFLATFADMLAAPEANATAVNFVRRKIRSTVNDAKTAEALTPPETLPLGCKRICVDTDYFATFNRPNVSLVDLQTTPVDRITASGVKTVDADYPLDALILATGFDAMTGALSRIDISGRHGRKLADKWAHGPINYLGMAVEGFPNLFIVNGPGSPSVTSNLVMTSELQTDWIGRLWDRAAQQGAVLIEASESAEADWSAKVEKIAEGTIFTSGCNSWFVGSNVPGKPRMFTAFAGGLNVYMALCDEVASRDYEGFEFADPAGTADG